VFHANELMLIANEHFKYYCLVVFVVNSELGQVREVMIDMPSSVQPSSVQRRATGMKQQTWAKP
jgi:hypothetical protein